MVLLDTQKLMECIDWENITQDTVTLKIDGEKLRQQIYEDLKLEITTDLCDDVPAVYFQDAPFIKIYPNEIFDEKTCKQLTIQLQGRFNKEIKTKLGITE